MDWVPTHERYVVCGSSNGVVGLYDTKEIKLMWEVNMDPDNPDAKVEDIICSPVDSNVVAVVSAKLFLIDLRTRKLEVGPKFFFITFKFLFNFSFLLSEMFKYGFGSSLL